LARRGGEKRKGNRYRVCVAPSRIRCCDTTALSLERDHGHDDVLGPGKLSNSPLANGHGRGPHVDSVGLGEPVQVVVTTHLVRREINAPE